MNSLQPFPYVVINNHFTEEQINIEWPRDNHPKWVDYRNPLECKRTFNDWAQLSESCRKLLASMMMLRPNLMIDMTGFVLDPYEVLIPDTTLWGGGCHEMQDRDHLDLHLDNSHHPYLGLGRRANAILFLDDWLPEWGGQLELWEPNKSEPTVSISPAKNRLVIFATSDKSLHRVKQVSCPQGVRRRSLAIYWFGTAVDSGIRKRALFLPIPGEPADPVKDLLRAKRVEGLAIQ